MLGITWLPQSYVKLVLCLSSDLSTDNTQNFFPIWLKRWDYHLYCINELDIDGSGKGLGRLCFCNYTSLASHMPPFTFPNQNQLNTDFKISDQIYS